MTPHRLRFVLAFICLLAPSAALGASGSAPSAGTWHRLPAAPIAPDFGARAAVWTGKEMLVFGREQQTALDARGNPYATGALNVAASFDPASNTWTRLEPPGPAADWGLSTVWTGKEMLVWGHGSRLAFNPTTSRWRRLPSSRLLAIHDAFGAVAWTGREMIGWGGGCCGDAFADGVAYDPSTNAWRALSHSPLPGNQHPLGAWTGHALFVLSGRRAAAYSPVTNAWRRIADAPAPRSNGRAVWDGREVLIVGGARVGLAYNPKTNRWRRLPAVDTNRAVVAVWTGKRLLVWAGRRSFAYAPATNQWSRLAAAPLAPRLEATGVWTGRSFIVWGGAATRTWGKYTEAGAAFTEKTR